MILEVDDILTDPQATALIIQWPTGVKYTAQTGGIGCDHPECEGFLISLPEDFQEFDDCSYGCQNLWKMPEAREKLANDLDKFFLERGYKYIEIDRERLAELSEGWWPVLYNKPIGERTASFEGTLPSPFKGYIHTGNCD